MASSEGIDGADNRVSVSVKSSLATRKRIRYPPAKGLAKSRHWYDDRISHILVAPSKYRPLWHSPTFHKKI